MVVVADGFVMAQLVVRLIDDRRPIDPPPIVQLRVIDRGAADTVTSRSSSPDSGGTQIFRWLKILFFFTAHL